MKKFIGESTTDNMVMDVDEEVKYYCKNCDAEVKPTDEQCPECGKDLKEDGKRVEVNISEFIRLSHADEVAQIMENLGQKKKVT